MPEQQRHPDTDNPEPPWMAAGRHAWWAWHQLSQAKGLLDQANAAVDLANAMSDLGTFLPEYDADTGELRSDDD